VIEQLERMLAAGWSLVRLPHGAFLLLPPGMPAPGEVGVNSPMGYGNAA
jgi:hypothetical protein